MNDARGWQLRLFSLFGFEVRLDLSWLLLALLITWSLAAGLFPERYPGLSVVVYVWMGAAVAVGVFLSIVLHEFAHSIVARRYDLPIRGITLFVFGGVAEMEHEPPSPKSEFLMAIAGPIASFLLAALFWSSAGAITAADGGVPAAGALDTLAVINLTVAVFNLVPAFPLDGGRVLRAVLWQGRGDLRAATVTSARIGRGFGLALIALGFIGIVGGNLVAGMWWILIGLFIRGAAGGAVRQQVVEEIFADRPVTDFMVREPVTVPPDLSIADWLEEYVYRHHFKMYPVVEAGKLLGSIATGDIDDLSGQERSRVTVRDRMRALSEANAVDASTGTNELLRGMLARNRNPRYLVVDQGRLLGIVTLRDLLDLVAVRMEVDRGN